jgi:membrane-bound metal-dependent hydrolase YbcI (DUF457 family)
MTPLGHFSVSYLVGKTSKSISLPAVIIGGILPDIDFLFFQFPWFNQFHRVVTHNLLFIGLVTFIGAFIRLSGQKRRVALSLLLGGALHLFVDSCLDSNPSNGIGIALLWPFYEGFFSPFNLFNPIENHVGWTDPAAVIKSSAWEIMLEIPVYMLALTVYLLRKRKNSKFEFRNPKQIQKPKI